MHMRLNALFTKIRKQNKIKETKEKDLSEMGKYTWATPTFILIYLANTIDSKAPKPVYGDNPAKPIEMLPPSEEVSCKLVSWATFK